MPAPGEYTRQKRKWNLRAGAPRGAHDTSCDREERGPQINETYAPEDPAGTHSRSPARTVGAARHNTRGAEKYKMFKLYVARHAARATDLSQKLLFRRKLGDQTDIRDKTLGVVYVRVYADCGK